MGYTVFTLHDFNKLGIKNGDVAKLAIREKAIIITLDSDFLMLNKNLQKKSRIVYIKIHPRDPRKIAELLRENLEGSIFKLNSPCKLIITEEKVYFDEL